MKIVLTLVELHQLVAKQWGIPLDSLSVELESGFETKARELATFLGKVYADFPDWRSTGRITAIKRLRELTSMGLAEAKLCIEESERALQNVRRTGEIIPPRSA